MKFTTTAATALLATVTVATPIEPRWISNTTTDAGERAAAVIEAFQHAWQGYYTYAFPHDSLLPDTDGYQDDRNGWGASAVDALSTAVIMQQQTIVNQILDHIVTIDYSQTATQVSLFETTIRYLGGMLSGYDLLNGPYQNLIGSKTAEVQALLNQAENLANVLKFAFNTTTGIPYNDLNINNDTSPDETNGLATIGTLVLEWTRLADLTGNKTYSDLARKGESYLLNPKPTYNEPWPGLVGTNVDINTGLFVDASGGWVGGDDSFYEYLIKTYVYDTKRFSTYKDRWVKAAESTITYLTSHPDSRPDLTYIAAFNNKTQVLVSEHLACFAGGNFILGGLVLNNQTWIDYGLAVTEGCYNTYNSTASKIGPEEFAWDPTQVPEGSAEFYNEHGFYITSPYYILRPEVIESYYYAYRATKDQKYRDWAWEAFVAINNTCRTPSGFSELANVNDYDGGGQLNNQDTFFFAEVLKYSYIIFLDDEEWQVNDAGVNNFVFNTEGHPLKVSGTPI